MWDNGVFIVVATYIIALSCPSVYAYSDVAVNWTRMEATYNPSLVTYGDQFISALKRTTFRKAKGKTFWVNHLYLCVGTAGNLQGLRCQAYNPWLEPYPECEFNDKITRGKTDVTGLGDVKVWVWPGRGVYAIFGRKPQRVLGGDRYCTSKVIYDQWVAQIRPEQGAGPWRLGQPLRLYLTDSYNYPEGVPYVMEKNWMPWVYRRPNGSETLYVTHNVDPHRILEVNPSGACEVRHETPGNPRLFSRFANYSLHGGPPVVYVDAKLATNGRPYYLGIMHYFEWLAAAADSRQQKARKSGKPPRKVKLYRHFAYKFRAEPPFEITDVSDELNLTFFRHPRYSSKAHIAFVAGLYLTEGGTVYISYGAGDREARVQTMTLAELEAQFTGRVAFLADGKGQG